MKRALLIVLINLTSFAFSQSWQDVGGGTNNSSHGMLTWNGKLVNLGSYNNPCNRVATWDGATWECLDNGVGIVARAGVVWNGNLVVVGDFWNNFQPCPGCNGVAVWDGTTWSALDQGFNNDVLTCTVYNGDLIIGGDFTAANGVPINRVARWNETTQTFESMGAVTNMDNDVRCMTVYDGELWVGGDFNNVGGQGPLDGLVKWDEVNDVWVGGNSGVDLIGGVNESVRVLYVNPNDGNLYMGGEFPELWDGDAPAEDFNMAGIAMYDGSNWYPLGTGLFDGTGLVPAPYCRAIHEYNGDIIVGGYFTEADGVPAQKIARWNTTTQTFSAMGGGFDGVGVDEYVKSAEVWNGIFFAGGAYTQAEGGPMNYIAQWYEAPVTAPIASITASSPTACAGECIYFEDNSTNSPTSWTWSFPGADVTSSTAEIPGNICYSGAGTYTVTLQACNANGCDNTTFDVTIGNTPTVTSNNETICEGETAVLTATPSAGGGTYYWSPNAETTQSINVTPGTTSSYTVTYTLSGCTSTPSISTVTVNASPTVTVNSETICEGQTITLTATPSIGGGSYSWSPGGETTPTISVSPTSSTSYSVDYLAAGCTGTGSATVTVSPTYNSTESVQVCENTLYTYPDGSSETITSSTAQTSTLSSVAGCDSIIVTNVTMNNSYALTENTSACENSTVTYPDGFNETITANTSHVSMLTTAAGCDSTITTNVTMVTAYNETESASVCVNTIYTYPDGTTETITGSTSHTSALTSVNGCDSIVVTTITALPNYSMSENVSVCENSSYTYPDGTIETITANTSHTSSITTVDGCDSIIVTNITVLNAYNITESTNACQNEVYVYPDGFSETITSNTSHTSNLSTVDGCDSLIVTNVTMNPNYNGTQNIDVCQGTNYIYPDGFSETITANSSHVSMLTTAAGCDSTITTNVTMVTAYNETESASVCVNTIYTYPDGTTETITGSTSHTSALTSVNGCDSIVVTTITALPNYATSENVSVCESSSYTYPDGTTETITSNTSHTSNLSSIYGCDSIVTTNVTMSPIYNISENINVCENTTITYPDGSTETIITNTSHISTLSSMSGCDSLVTTNVTMQTAFNISESIEVCTGANFTYPDGSTSTNITINESHTSNMQSMYGCDSTIITNLIVVTTFNTSETIEICSGNSYTYPDGTTSSNITIDESHVSNLTSQAGCDSIVTTYLTVPPMASLDPIQDQTICYGESVTLTATPSISGGSFEWSPGAQTSPSITITPLSTTTYTIGYTLNNCSYSEESVTITVEAQIDNTTSEASNIITSNQSGATYQWLDCNSDFSPINGATSQDYAPVQNGSYAVEVTVNNCSDTSDCIDITTIGVNELESNSIFITPNPASDQLVIHGSVENYVIYNALGQRVIVGKTKQVKLSSLPDGIYIISINDGLVITRFVKKS